MLFYSLRRIRWLIKRRRRLLSCTKSTDAWRLVVTVCRYKRKPTLGPINLIHGRNCWRHSTLHQWPIPKPDVDRKSRFLPPLGASPSEYCHNVCCAKIGMVGLPDGEKSLRIFFLFFDQKTRTYVTDRHPDRHRTTAQAALMHSIVRQKLR